MNVAAGDYIIRADQPYRTLADMYFSVQNYPVPIRGPMTIPAGPCRSCAMSMLKTVTDKAILDQPMTLLTADASAAAASQGTGNILVVDHTTDNALMTFRFKNAGVKMLAAEDDFDLGGHKFRAGAFIIPDADRSQLEPIHQGTWPLRVGRFRCPRLKPTTLNVPRIGFVHSWQRTQDEGWVRAALDHYGVPYTYFADQKLREGNLRSKYDVILYPHVGGTPSRRSMAFRRPAPTPSPTRKPSSRPTSARSTPSDDIRGGMGIDGLAELAKFVDRAAR